APSPRACELTALCRNTVVQLSREALYLFRVRQAKVIRWRPHSAVVATSLQSCNLHRNPRLVREVDELRIAREHKHRSDIVPRLHPVCPCSLWQRRTQASTMPSQQRDQSSWWLLGMSGLS